MSNSSVLNLKPSEVYEFLTASLLNGHVPYIAGPPAIGKSQVVHQVAEDANAKVIDLRLSQILSEDMTGLPERDEKTGKAKYLPFETFPLEGDEVPDGYDGWILFLDELSSASEEVLAASYSLILDHTVGGKRLHPKCRIVAAGNRASDSAIARELPDTLLTRMLPVQMKHNVKDWLKWANGYSKKNDFIIQFVKDNPSMLYAEVKADQRDELETYPTPRGWEKVMHHMNMHEAEVNKKPKKEVVDKAGVPTGEFRSPAISMSPVIFNLMAAAIGTSAARSIRESYEESIQIPFPWEIAQSPTSCKIPGTQVGKAQIINDLVPYFLESNEDSRDHILTYVNRVGGEFCQLFHNVLKGKLGSTTSDKRMVDEIGKRLSIDPLLGVVTQKGGAASSDSDIPF